MADAENFRWRALECRIMSSPQTQPVQALRWHKLRRRKDHRRDGKGNLHEELGFGVLEEPDRHKPLIAAQGDVAAQLGAHQLHQPLVGGRHLQVLGLVVHGVVELGDRGIHGGEDTREGGDDKAPEDSRKAHEDEADKALRRVRRHNVTIADRRDRVYGKVERGHVQLPLWITRDVVGVCVGQCCVAHLAELPAAPTQPGVDG
eukprot:7379882-Prymnesium_polylepis.2